jgi:hypothetical protein
MRRRPFTKWNLALAALLAASGCVGGFGSGTPSFREPGFRATSVRRPALLVRVSVPAELGRRERDCIAENYEAAVVEGLERAGILAVDMASVPETSARPLEGLDRTAALSRPREAGLEQLVIVDTRLFQGDLAHCKQAGRARSGPTTFWETWASRSAARPTASRSSWSRRRRTCARATWTSTARRAASSGARACTSSSRTRSASCWPPFPSR